MIQFLLASKLRKLCFRGLRKLFLKLFGSIKAHYPKWKSSSPRAYYCSDGFQMDDKKKDVEKLFDEINNSNVFSQEGLSSGVDIRNPLLAQEVQDDTYVNFIVE